MTQREVQPGSQSGVVTPGARGVLHSWSPDHATAVGLREARQGSLVDIDGAGPALVTALHHDHEELAPLTVASPSPRASVRLLGSLETPAGLDLVGRAIDCLGGPLDEGGPVSRERLEPIFGTDPAVLGGVDPRLTTGFSALDLKRVLRAGSSLTVTGDRAHVQHLLRHQRTLGRVCIFASLLPVPRRYLRALQGDLDCIHVSPGPDAAPAARWLVPWTAMALAASLRRQGEHVLVLLDDLGAWQPWVHRFPDHGTWSTQLARLTSRAFGNETGSVTLLARVEERSSDLQRAFDHHVDLWRAARGDVEPLGSWTTWKQVRPPIRLASMAVLGGLCHANVTLQEIERTAPWHLDMTTVERESIEIGRRVRACSRWRPGSTVDSTEQIACLFAVGHLKTLAANAVDSFTVRYLAELRERHASLLARVRRDRRFREEDEQLLVSLAETVAASIDMVRRL